jgi:hypothetical protein
MAKVGSTLNPRLGLSEPSPELPPYAREKRRKIGAFPE